MNRKLLFVLPLSFMLAGCVAKVESTNHENASMACKTQSGWICKGEAAAPTVIINTKNGHLKIKPACAKANDDTMLIFRLVPKGNKDKGVVEIFPKDDENDWLAGKNDEYQDLIMIAIPKDLAEGSYHYGIKTDTDCVDPRVRVEAPDGPG